MVGQDVYKYKFKRKMTGKTMDTASISENDKSYVTEPNLMFQRLLAGVAAAVIRREDISIEEAF